MSKIYVVHIHSFVDLITNSSTEIYIQASEKTIKTIKKLIDDILFASGNETLTCDDLFTIDFDKARLFKYYCYEEEDDDGKKWTEESFFEKTRNDDESSRDIYIKVIPKNPKSDAAKAAAKVLSDLTSLFSIEEGHN